MTGTYLRAARITQGLGRLRGAGWRTNCTLPKT